jgi:hypothetical protein
VSRREAAKRRRDRHSAAYGLGVRR